MRHTKTFLRADGSKVQISVTLTVDFTQSTPRYDWDVYARGPRKRTFFGVTNHDDYSWRALGRDARNAADLQRKLEHVTMAEVQETALELWALVKPDFNTSNKSSSFGAAAP
jgi:hypothetical protein